MDEQVQVENNEVEPQDNGTDIPKTNALEDRARAMGWRPQEEWEGAPEEWIDAKEYVGRKPLFDHMSVMRRELKETQKALRALTEHHQKVRENEYKRAIEDLKSAKKAAFDAGDTDKIVEIDDKLTDIKAQAIAQEKADQQPVNRVHPNFIAWVERNSWYAQNPELRAKADEIGTGHALMHPDKSPDEVLEYVEREIKKSFRNPNKDRPSAVDGASNKEKPAGSKSTVVLTEQEEAVMKTLVRNGVMTKEEYMTEISRNRTR